MRRVGPGRVLEHELRARNKDVDVSVEFQARRKEAWRLIWPWVVVEIVGCPLTLLAYQCGQDSERLFVRLVPACLFLALFLVGLKITWLRREGIRCPVCDSTQESQDDIDLSPKRCVVCGAKLR
jgi:hypothetical protein